jgi:hypothetical protein
MAKPFYRYEDVPLLLASEGQEPVMVFANRASISASQPLEAKKFAEDYSISFADVFEDVEFKGVEVKDFLLGPPGGGPGMKIPSSVELIKSGQKIAYPNGQALYVEEDAHAGDYHIKVKSTGDTFLDIETDVPYGEIDVLRTYAAQGEIRGRLNITYYMNTGNIHSFADLTGLMDPTIYPQVNETKITGSLGDYKFNDAYLTEMSFSAEPFQVIETNIDLDIYGKMEYVEGWSESVFDNYPCVRENQLTVPHAMNTKIYGANSVGIQYPLSFSYSIYANQIPEIPVPISGYADDDGELPVRVAKNEVDITIDLEGEKLDPFLKITGQRADVTISLSDIGFDENFTDNNFGKLKEFKLAGNLVLPDAVPEELEQYGVVDQDALSVSEGGFLRGRASVRQAYR